MECLIDWLVSICSLFRKIPNQITHIFLTHFVFRYVGTILSWICFPRCFNLSSVIQIHMLLKMFKHVSCYLNMSFNVFLFPIRTCVFESYVSSKRGREIISRKISYILVLKNITCLFFISCVLILIVWYKLAYRYATIKLAFVMDKFL